MFNSDQQEHMSYLGKQDPSTLCYCGWYKKGECESCPPDKSNLDRIQSKCDICGSPADAHSGIPQHYINCPQNEINLKGEMD